MASELIVQTLKGPTSGANANKVIIPSGQTLECSSAVVSPGSILQKTTVSQNTQQSFTSSSYADTNVYIELTSEQANSDFFMTFCVGVSPNNFYSIYGRLVRRISGLSDVTISEGRVHRAQGTSTGDADRHYPVTYIDSPSAAAGTTVQYMFQVASGNNGSMVRVNDNSNTTITLMEIAG